MITTDDQPLRLTLLSHAATAAMRRGQLPSDDLLDERGLDSVRRWPGVATLPTQAVVICSPARCAVATAEALSLEGQPDAALRDIDMGRWQGLRFTHLAEAEPEALQAWLQDPHMATHGGESFVEAAQRMGQWMDQLTRQGPRDVLAITHAAILRAAMLHALGAAPDCFRQIEVAPLSVLRLTHGRRGWTWSLPSS